MRWNGVLAALAFAAAPMVAAAQDISQTSPMAGEDSTSRDSECFRLGRYPVDGPGSGTGWDDLDPAVLIPLCEAWIAEHPADFDAMSSLGRVLYKAKRHEDALNAMEPALEAGNPWALVNAGNMFRGSDTYWADGRKMEDFARAKGLFEQAAAQDFAWGLSQLAQLHRNGWGVDRDIRKAMELWRRAADLGMTAAKRDLAAALVDAGELDQTDPVAAVALLREAGEAGDPLAYNTLGYWYWKGQFVPRDFERAEGYFRQAIATGKSYAPNNLAAALLDKDRPGGPDVETAVAVLEREGETGDPIAWNNLGLHFLEGKLVPRDLARAETYFRKALAAGVEYAPGNLANTLMDPEYPPAPQTDRAIAILEQAARDGSANAALRLGNFYYTGDKVPRDYRKARTWYEQATAKSEEPNALRMLGHIHFSGLGTEKDRVKAFEYRLRAANAGESLSLADVGDMYEIGNGTAQDLDKAEEYFRRAAQANPWSFGSELAAFLIRTGRGAGNDDITAGLEKAAELGNGTAFAALAFPSQALQALGVPAGRQDWIERLETITDGGTFQNAVLALYQGNLAEDRSEYAWQLIQQSTLVSEGSRLEAETDFLMGHSLYGLLFDRVIAAQELSVAERRERGIPDTYISSFKREMDTGKRWGKADTPQNRERLQRLSDLGFTGATWRLYYHRKYIDDPQYDLGEALKLAEILAREDLPEGPFSLAHTRWRIDPLDPELPALIDAAIAAGPSATAKANLAELMLELPQDRKGYARIAALAQDALADDKPRARFILYRLLWDGLGMKRDRQRALDLLTQAAFDDNDTLAMARYADHLLSGAGVTVDPDLARHLYRLAEQRNYYFYGPVGLARLAVLGSAGDADADVATQWLRTAAKRGSPEAPRWLAACAAQPDLACYRKQPGLGAPPLAPLAPLAVPGIDARFSAVAASKAEASGTDFRVDQFTSSNDRLARIAGAANRPDDLLVSLLDRIAYESNGQLRKEGTQDSFYYNQTISCQYGTAAATLRQIGRIDEATYFAKQAVNHLQRARRMISGLETPFQDCFLDANGDRYRYLADLFVEQGRFAEAETVLAMLKDYEHTEYVRGPVKDDSSKQDVALVPAEDALSRQHAEVFVALREGRITHEQARDQFASANGAFRAELMAIRDAAAELDASMDGNGDREAAARRVSMALMRDLRDFDDRTAALHAIVMPDKLHWIVTTSQFQQAVTIPLALSDLRKRVAVMRESIIYDAELDSAASGKLGYDDFFAPVDALLRNLGMDRVLVSLDDALRYIPLSALHDGEDFLLRRYAFSVIRERSDIARAADGRPEQRIAAFGMSKAAAGFSALEGVPTELRGIVADDGGEGFVPGMIRLDEQFDRDSLVSALDAAYPVIHLASHFSLEPTSPDQSVLLLGDGNTVSLSDLTLDGEFNFFDAKLLTLSACQTGLAGQRADGREVDSLAALAQEAGVPAVLASLWSVSDASTARLMQAYYRYWLEEGMDKGRAMQAAQLELLDDPTGKFAEPFFWSAFLVMGDGR